MRNSLFLLVPALVAIVGCSDRNDHNVDTIRLTPAQAHDVFLASDNLGPDTNVIILANVPKARYQNGAIILTGGKELYVVQPHAWRTYTGTAISTEEAARMIARAEKLDVAVRDVSDAAQDLQEYVSTRTVEARKSAEQQRRSAEAERAAQDHQADEQQRQRDHDISDISMDRDQKIAAAYKEGSDQVQAINDEYTKGIGLINKHYNSIESQENESYAEHLATLRESQQGEMDKAARATQAAGDSAYISTLKERQASDQQILRTAHNSLLEGIHQQRDGELATLHDGCATRIADVRRLSEQKVERLRREADTEIEAVRRKQAADAVAPAAVPPATRPAAGSAPTGAPRAAAAAAPTVEARGAATPATGGSDVK